MNPQTSRPYPFSAIENAMKDIHYSVLPSKGAKQQALDVIKQLQEIIPIQRALMRIGLSLPASDAKRLKPLLTPFICEFEDEDWDTMYTCEASIEPGSYREIEMLVRENTRGKGHLEVLSLAMAY